MDKRTSIVLGAVTALLVFLLVSTAILVGASGGSATSLYIVEPGAATGGGYQLTGLVWQFRGTASNGHYRLVEPAGSSSGCCCTYLPCVLR